MKSVIAALSALICLSANTAFAQSPISNPTGLVPDLSFGQITGVLNEAGIANTVVNTGEGALLAIRHGNRVALLEESVCRPSGACSGLMMYARVSGGGNLDTINRFNNNSKPVGAVSMGQEVVLKRYLIADYGTTRGSLLVNIDVFMSMIDQWFAFTSSQAVGVSFDPLIAEGDDKTANRIDPAAPVIPHDTAAPVDAVVLEYLMREPANTAQ